MKKKKARRTLSVISIILVLGIAYVLFCMSQENSLIRENRVVNALLRVKAERFDAAGIAFDCRCRLPEGYPLRSTELCSLFSNVLDNAYRAASLCTDASPAVSLTCDVQGNALTLRCVNSCPPEDAPRESGHGLGLEILRDLAQRHNGAVTAERSGNTFTAMVQLLPDPVS